MRVYGYIRVSQVNGRKGDSFQSPQQQKDAIKRYAEMHGHTIVRFFTDLDQSGGKMDRPDFKAMMAHIHEGDADGVIVAKLDRFGRTLVGALEALKQMSERKIGGKEKPAIFIAVREGFDPSTPYGKAFMSIALIFAELELERIKIDWQTAQENAIDRGVWMARTPFGYRKDPETKTLEPDPEEAPYVKAIYRMRKNGKTWAEIAGWLNAEGVPPRQSGKQWVRETIKALIRNEVYLGVNEKGSRRRENSHEAIVGKADWLAAQDVFAHGTHQPGGKVIPLASLVRCAGCSYIMAGRGYKPKGKERIAQYQCRVHQGSGTCPAPANINDHIVLPWVTEQFFKKLRKDQVLVPERTNPELDVAEAEYQDAVANYTADSEDLELEEVLGRDGMIARLRKRREVMEQKEIVRNEARRSAQGIDLPDVDDLRKVWDTFTTQEQRRLMASAIEAVFVKRGRGKVEDRCKILWKTDKMPGPFSGPGYSVPIREFAF